MNDAVSPPNVVLIIKRSAWERVADIPGDPIHELLKAGDPTVAHVMQAHQEHQRTVALVEAELRALGARVTRFDRMHAVFDDADVDLVITVGGDGTLLHASHTVSCAPVLGVNSAPSTSVGFFCAARQQEVAVKLRAALAGELKQVELARMQVRVNDKVASSRVLNDALFCHASPAVTSRYIIEYGERSEEHKSSGIWIGPAAGSTAAQHSAGGVVLPLTSRQLQLVVREPYTTPGQSYALTHLILAPGKELRLRSKSRHMRLYLDGPDHIVEVGLGDIVTLSLSPEPLKLLGLGAEQRLGYSGASYMRQLR